MSLLLYILLSAVLINACYYIIFLRFGLFFKVKQTLGKDFPVSLLICCKNEAENLKQHIPHWLKQDHPDFELILIDDHSTDQTRAVIEHFAAQDSRIVPVFVSANDRFASSKKYALTLGIKKARHMRLVFTDADCLPASYKWLRIMAANFSATSHLVLGYGGYVKKFGLLNALIRFETFITALQYFSYAFAKIPYMGVGRNLGYTRILYDQQKGFSSHMAVKSGDDDLFVNAAATSTNTALCLQQEAFTYSKPKTKFSDWVTQKRRHVSTASYYKPEHKLLLGLYYLANFGFWVLWGIYLFINPMAALYILIGRTLLQLLCFFPAAKKLKTGGLIFFAPLLEVFLICMQLVIFSLNLSSKQTSWK